MIENLCKETERNDRQVERERGRGEAAEFSDFRRQWWLLGWVRSQLSERKRESASKTVKKRTRDEKRGNTRERDVLGTMTKGEEGDSKVENGRE